MAHGRRQYVRRGDFLVRRGTLAAAEESYAERSERSRQLDNSLRAPIVSSYEYWKENQRIVDYPGIDTPTDDPRHDTLDFPTVPGRQRITGRRDDGDVRLDPVDRGQSFDEQVADLRRRHREQVDRFVDMLPRW